MRIYKLLAALSIAALSVSAGMVEAGPSACSACESAPDATLRLSEGRLTTGIKYMWGRGSLKFRDGRHEFHLSGAPVADVGTPNLSATGKVYHLRQLSDFSGTYVAVDPSREADGDGATVPLRNEHGVLILLNVEAAAQQGSRTSGSVRIQLND